MGRCPCSAANRACSLMQEGGDDDSHTVLSTSTTIFRLGRTGDGLKTHRRCEVVRVEAYRKVLSHGRKTKGKEGERIRSVNRTPRWRTGEYRALVTSSFLQKIDEAYLPPLGAMQMRGPRCAKARIRQW